MEDVEMAQPAEKDGEAERQAGGSGNDGSLWADFTEMEESKRLLEDKNLELAEELDRSAAEVETMRKKVKEAEKLVEKLKKAMVKEKAVSGGLKGSIGHLEKKLAKAQGDRKAADGRLGEFERWIELFRKEEKEECGCQKGKAHYVEALGGECHDPKSLALSTLARNEKIASEDVNLMKCEEDFRKKLGKSERLEALRKFAGICPTWASKIMRNDWTEEELEWREAAESLKKEVMYRNQPQKAIIQEKYILVGQRMGLKSKAVFEVRTATISTWKQKFGWEKVEKAVVLVEWTKDDKQLKALVNLVEEIAKEVWELVVVPARMECGYDEVGGVTETWQKVRKTALNVEVVDLMTPVGPKKMPLILCDLKPGSLEKMMEYLACAIPGHSLVDRLRADVEDSEPKIKKHRAN
ncbi:hypothetical protein L5515_015305 [Caenorhabditis briggsae]|uniref:Uncharacterized protein n=1 Tax=Caenorhabditis briggsae TaxID=6238 RepID=A0AAE9EEH0_CAEBR|nr:hypothetical protein L5515_015305 [Caenorhabditis briggsae]